MAGRWTYGDKDHAVVYSKGNRVVKVEGDPEHPFSRGTLCPRCLMLRWPLPFGAQLVEREFRGVRRRTRPMGFFPHEESAQRIFYGVTNGIHQNGHHPLPIKSAENLT